MSLADDIGTQLRFSTGLLASINALVSNASAVTDQLSAQQTSASAIVNSLRDTTVSLTNINNTGQRILESLNALPENVFSGPTAINQAAIDSLDGVAQSLATTTANAQQARATVEDLDTSKMQPASNEVFTDASAAVEAQRGIVDWGVEKLKDLRKSFFELSDVVTIVTDFKNPWVGLAKMLLKLLWGGIKLVGKMIGLFARFGKLIVSMPIMMAEFAADIGGKLRNDIVVTIGNAVQTTKELFDHTSNIGSVMQETGNIAKESLRELVDPASRMTKLFGEGTAGATAYIEAVKATIEGMGHFGEIFALSLKDRKSALFVVEAMKGMKISYEQMGYYALEAGTSTDNIFDTLHNTHMAIKSAADESDQDFVQVAEAFHKARVNIKEFGHLTSSQIANLVTRMRRLNVSTEELTSLFEKFSSYEEAASTSALLNQSFGMVVDALDLITASDPGQIVYQFRDAMLATGKSFGDLSRHEKALMSQTTGLSVAALKTVMSYNDAHLSYDEMRKIASDTDPTEQQTKMMKSLSGAINQIQRVMNKSNPFKAFAEGLKNNVLAQDELREITMLLSNSMESLYRFGLNMDDATISRLTTPAIIILKKIEEVLTGDDITNLFTRGANFISTVAEQVTKDVKPRFEKQIMYLEETIEAINSTHDPSERPNIIKGINSMLDSNIAVKGFLEKNSLLGNNDKIGKNVTMAMIVASLRSATKSASTSQGKKQIALVAKGVYEMTDGVVKKAAGLDLINLKRGVGKRIEDTKNHLKKIYEAGSPMFKTIFDIGRKLMGGLIKGTVMGATVVLKLLNGTLDQVWDTIDNPISRMFQDRGEKFTILKWLGISDKTAAGFKKQLGLKLGKVFRKTGKIASIFLSVLGAILDIMGDIVSGLTAFVAAGISELMKESWLAWAFFDKSDVQSIKVANTAKTMADRLTLSVNQKGDKMETLNKVVSKTYKEYMEAFSGTPWGDYLNQALPTEWLWSWGQNSQYKMRALISTLSTINKNNNPKSYKAAENDDKAKMSKALTERMNKNMSEFSFFMSFDGNIEKHYYDKLKNAETKALSFINVKDAVVKGKFKIVTPQGLVIEPDTADDLELVAAKDGGILSTVYEKINKIYSDTSESIKVLTHFNNNIRSDESYEASDDLLNEFCDTVNDVINILANRKINATATSIKYSSEI